jgi:hypothetical protein
MPFKKGGSTRDILLGSLMLEQYGSMRRYSARQSYARAVRKHEIISLVPVCSVMRPLASPLR